MRQETVGLTPAGNPTTTLSLGIVLPATHIGGAMHTGEVDHALDLLVPALRSDAQPG